MSDINKIRVIDLSKIIKIRRFDNAVVFYEQETFHVCEPTTKIPTTSTGFYEVVLKEKKGKSE